MRKGYGFGYVVMGGGRGVGAEVSVAWPTADIAAMSIPGAVDVAFRRAVDQADDPTAARAAIIADFMSRTGAVRAAGGFGIDDVIDPRDTRPVLIDALRRSAPRRTNPQPFKHHPITPV